MNTWRRGALYMRIMKRKAKRLEAKKYRQEEVD
jgi:hypothetical protein